MASGLEYESRLYATKHKDWFGVVNVIGLAALFKDRYVGFNIKTQVELYYDFALVDAFALDNLREKININGVREVTRSLGYYYATGGTARFFVSIERNRWHSSYYASYQSYNSIDKHNKDIGDFSLLKESNCH